MAGMDPEVARHYTHYYDEGVSEWRRLGALDKVRNIMDRCSGRKFKNVVEIGAGDGAILQELSRVGFAEKVSAIEVSQSAVEVIRGRDIENLHEVFLFDGYSVPREDKSYDLVILSHVVEHVEHPRLLLREAARIADYVFVEVPLDLKIRTPRNFKWTDTGHINIYSPLTIRHLLQSTGLEIVEERVTNTSCAVYRFSLGKLAPVHYAIKWLALKTLPSVATRLFTYHWSALCRPTSTRE